MRRCTLASATNERLWPGVAGWWNNLNGIGDGESARATSEEVVSLLTTFGCQTPAERQRVLAWYRGYQQVLTHLVSADSRLCPAQPVDHTGERVWILRSIDDRLHWVQADLCWLDQRNTASTQEEGSDTMRSCRRTQRVPTPSLGKQTDTKEELT